MRTIIQACLICSFALALAVNPVTAQMSTVEQATSVEKFKAITQSLEDLLEEIPQYYLSPEALAESNDYDPEQIAAWVKENIQFTPSPGYLLSPQSALQTATGNALEQSMLLQNVLVQAGLEVRISKATLDSEQAMTLLHESFVASPASQWQLEPAIRDQHFKRLSVQLGDYEDSLAERYSFLDSLTSWTDSPVYKEAKALAKEFSAAIGKDRIKQSIPSAALLQPWLRNAQDYYFVKYRFGQGDPWQEAHPAFSVSKPAIASSAYHTDGFKNLHHQVTLQAFITREVEGKTETIPVSGVHKETASDLFEQQLQFTTLPSGMRKAIEDKSMKSLESGQFFSPAINGELAVGARIFALNGADYSPAEISDPMGIMSVTAKEKIGQFSEHLDSKLGEAPVSTQAKKTPTSRLLHYFISIEWSAPNGHKRSLRRTLYREQQGQDPADILAGITQSAVLAATPASLTPAAESYQSLNTIRSAFSLLIKLQSEQYTQSQILSQLNAWAASKNDLVFNSAAKLSEEAAGSGQLFSQAPVIAIKWQQQTSSTRAAQPNPGPASTSPAITTFDYLINSAQVAIASGETVEIDQPGTLGYGVWSTYSEAIVMSGTQQRNGLTAQSISAASTFNQALSNTEITVLDAASLNGASTTNKDYIQPSLATQVQANPEYVFLIPKPTANTPTAAYYRINPITGETLGYTIDGRGAATAEHIMMGELVIYTAAGVGKILACSMAGTEGEWVTCASCAFVQLVIAMMATLLGPLAGAVVEAVPDVACNWL